MVNQVKETIKKSINTEYISANQLDILEVNNDILHYLILPCAGPQVNNIIKYLNNNIQQILPNNVKTRIAYTGKNFDTKFQIKDLSKNRHEHD